MAFSFHALQCGLLQILLCGQSGELCIVLTHLIVYHLYNIIRCDDSEDVLILESTGIESSA